MQSRFRSQAAKRSCGGLQLACIRTGFALGAALLACATNAAEHRFSLLLDTDSSLTTGCAVNVGNRSESGIEQVWTAVVTTSANSARVTRIERQTCIGGTLGAPSVFASAGWSAGIGTAGTAATESFVPRSFRPTAGANGVRRVSSTARRSATWDGSAS